MVSSRLWILAVVFSIYFGAVLSAGSSKHLIEINEDRWKDILKGEWMIEFHAPWCPACKDLSKTWNSFADWSKDLEIKVAAVDVTANPALSGRFLVTALPTIYHVKDGVFRLYSGTRDKDEFISFIEEKKWTVVDPIPSWKHPDTPQMAVVATFFKLSMYVRDLHNFLVEQKGLPPVASYLIFGGATLVLGCILGFFIVCIIDCIFPATPPAAAPVQAAPKQKGKQQEKDKKQKEAEGKKKKQKGEEEERKARDSQASSQSEAENSQASMSEGEGSADESTVRDRKKQQQGGSPSKAKETPKAGAEGKKKK